MKLHFERYSILFNTIAVCAILLSTLPVWSVAQRKSKALPHENSATVNVLTPAEKSAGWKLLFDGKSWNGWRGFRREKMPDEGWAIEDGAIKHIAGNGEQSKQGGDIITVGKYDTRHTGGRER